MEKVYFFRKMAIGVLLLFATEAELQAQITIGSNDKPESYEVLKLMSSSDRVGLRLTRHSEAELETLTSYFLASTTPTEAKSKAEGLLVYNTDIGQIVYWDGTRWKKVAYGNNFLNGIHLDEAETPAEVKLGGELMENTTINQNGYEFTMTSTSGGTLSIDNDHFKVKDSTVQMGSSSDPIDLKINDGLTILGNGRNIASLNSNDNGVNMVASAIHPTVADSIALRVNVDTTTVTGIFHHNTDLSSLSNTRSIVMTAADTHGTGSWINLTPTIASEAIPTPKASTGGTTIPISSTTSISWTDFSDVFNLDTGRWLVMGRFKSYTSVATNGTNSAGANYLTLLRVYNKTTEKVLYTSAELPERKASGNEPNGSYCSPSIVAFITSTNPTDEYVVQIATRKSGTFVPNQSWVGDSYLRKVQLRK